ncbi:LPXTG cell wall anchor domain-containing protein [Flaviflagellibacter deserti]|uniref:LPXTG cell wall anchor domain-containing protein n=1 Tax=Flaviflagellibacter deserti TaxID=2267266 RepID=A0ABV9Z4U5_9HYPH
MAYHDGQWPQTGDKPANWETLAAVMIASALAVFLMLAVLLPAGLVVPTFAIVSLMAGAGIALYAWLHGDRQMSGRVTVWDVASTCVFLGFAAGVLGDHQYVLDLTHTLAASGQ